MKFLLAIVFALPFSSFAGNFASCELFAFTFTTSNGKAYKLIDSARLGNKWVTLLNKDITLKQTVDPVSYLANFSLDGSISGSLTVKGDQTLKVSDTVSLFEALELEVEEKYNHGKILYKLQCGIE